MQGYREGMLLVRAELCEQLAAMQARAGRLASGEFAASVRDFRMRAASYGLTPVVRLAEAMEQDLARAGGAGRCNPASLYFERLQDAIGCGRTDEQTSEAMIASIAVRFCA